MKTYTNVTLYKCEHCNRKMQQKPAMIRHEQHCKKNPKTFSACQTCKHIEEGEIEYGEHRRSTTTYRCTKLNKDLYPYKVVRKGHLKKYPGSFEGQELMPNKCDAWQQDENNFEYMLGM